MESERSDQYAEIYFPASMAEEKAQVVSALQDIDCNFSKLLQVLLPSIKELAMFVKKEDNNYRHYHWSVIFVDKKTGEVTGVQSTFPLASISAKGISNEEVTEEKENLEEYNELESSEEKSIDSASEQQDNSKHETSDDGCA